MPSALISNQRLAQQIDFIIEIDRLKQVMRRTLITGGSRRENSAEHSWHLAMMALVLSEHADVPVNVGHVIRMVLIHDIVEIDAGDTFFYDGAGMLDKAEREQRAADRLFGLLPADQAAEMRALWDEFEAHESAEARFALALDRLMPLLHNYLSDGYTWHENGIRPEQVTVQNNTRIAGGSAALAAFADRVVAEAVSLGYFPAATSASAPHA
jgi:putative hydrolase of HD superfamily